LPNKVPSISLPCLKIMHTNVWLTLKWKDFQMTWSPVNYGGIKVYFYGRAKIALFYYDNKGNARFSRQNLATGHCTYLINYCIFDK
jgi:hypothetical protein